MKRSICITGPCIWIPVRKDGEDRLLSIYEGSEKIFEFMVPVNPETSAIIGDEDFYGTLNTEPLMGKELTFEGDFPDHFFEALLQMDKPYRPRIVRPTVHMTAETGWLNDPNGMVYDGQTWHLYYQHNPFSKKWHNMTWGHAISKDLLHFENLGDVLYPDEDGMKFSGCGYKDAENVLGYGRDALIFYYTEAGGHIEWSKDRESTQWLAVSTDGGNTLKKERMILDTLPGKSENRDPKVYRFEDTDRFYMILFLADPDEFAIFTSEDLLHFTETQRLHLPGLQECPDLRPLPVVDEAGNALQEKVYMLSAADGTYVLGHFDGEHFEAFTETLEGFGSLLPYAAQTYHGCDRVIRIPWLRMASSGKPFTGAMGLPRTLYLQKEADGTYSLMQPPVEEYTKALKSVIQKELTPEDGGENFGYCDVKDSTYEVNLKGKLIPDFQLALPNGGLMYEAESGTLMVTGTADHEPGYASAFSRRQERGFDEKLPGFRKLTGISGLSELSLLSDDTILEITIDGGKQVFIYEMEQSGMNGGIDLESAGNMSFSVSEL